MKELSSKFLIPLRYVPYIIDENPKIQRFLSCLSARFKHRIHFDNLKSWRKLWRRQISVMSKERKEKVCPIGRLKIQVILINWEEGSSQTKILGVSHKTSPKTTIKKLILRTKYPKILQHQREGIYLTILLEILNNGNLSNAGNAKDHTMPNTVQTRRETSTTYTLSRKKKQLEMWPTRCIG